MSNESISKRSKSVSGIQKKDQNFRILMMNCQSIRNKRSELHECVEHTNPDAIIGCESWLSKEHNNVEIFPDGYNKNVFRKDRTKNGGGVFIALHDNLTTSTVENSKNDCQLQWAEIQSKKKSAIIGSYYRPPNSNLDALNILKSSIANVSEHSKDKPIILAGDFNLPHIDWETNTVKTGSNQLNHHQELIEIIEDSRMEQLQLKPSRENNILDLFLTNQPSLVKSCNTIPGISDPNMIIIDTDLKPRYHKPKRREINIFKKANWDQIKTDIIDLGTRIMQSKTSVEEKWTELKNRINNALGLNVPKTITPNRHNLRGSQIKTRKCFERNTSYSKELSRQKEQKTGTNTGFKSVQRKRAVRQAHWSYLNNVLESALEEGNSKPFWKYNKSKRTDNFGVAGIKKNGILHQDSKSKAELLIDQFKSVFTKENAQEPITEVSEPKYPSISDINIEVHGVVKLLTNLSINKASGPDNIANKILKACAEELAPVMSHIFQLGLTTGELPSDWRNTNITPIFKKAINTQPQIIDQCH
jgi:exonuclease III